MKADDPAIGNLLSLFSESEIIAERSRFDELLSAFPFTAFLSIFLK